MIIIADSGSTKTEWWTLSNGEVVSKNMTQGFNPYYQTEDFITIEIRDVLLPQLEDLSKIESIHYYGSGCSTQANREKIERAIFHSIPEAKVIVEHDLLAAARATCGNQPGITCIMGTGSNSCQYDGANITENLPSLGYLLADEGSGVHMGKTLIKDLLLGMMPAKLSEELHSEYQLDLADVLHRLYQEPMPNKYLASFSVFILQRLNEPYMHNLAFNSFESFVKNSITKYSRHLTSPVHFVGSIAFHFQDLIREVCSSNNLEVGVITKSPLEGLVNFHKKEGIE